MPDTLLDAVKEEQNRAREAGRSARGAHVSGAGNRGESYCVETHFLDLKLMTCFAIQAVVFRNEGAVPYVAGQYEAYGEEDEECEVVSHQNIDG